MFAKLRHFSGRRQSYCPFLPQLARALGTGEVLERRPHHPHLGEGTVVWLGCVCVVPVTSLEGRVSLASGSGWLPGVHLLCPVKGGRRVLLWCEPILWVNRRNEAGQSWKPVCGGFVRLPHMSRCEWRIQFLPQRVKTKDQEFTR